MRTSERSWVGRALRDALRVTAAGVGFLLQALLVVVLTVEWLTPADQGAGGRVVAAELVVVAVELVIGLLWWGLPLWRRRQAPGVDEWWDLVTRRLPLILVVAGLVSFVGLVVRIQFP